MNGVVHSLAVFDDGSGSALYAGGNFTTAGGSPAGGIARWNGSSWSSVGGGTNGLVRSLVVHDDGNGPALFAGGGFSNAGGMSASKVAKWDGTSWSALGGGLNANVYALAVFDDGSGPALYAGGRFTAAGGVAASRIAHWQASNWSALGSGMNDGVLSLAVFDDGRGPALYAGGGFTNAGGGSANRIARWDGVSWSALASGMDNRVHAQVIFDEGSGPALFAAGAFLSSTSGDGHIAKWVGCLLKLGFDTEDDFETPLANGQDIASPPEFGRLVSISSSGPNAGAAIFDSTPGGANDPSQDRDLLVGSGHVLILQTNENTTQSVPGRFDRPNDDSDGGTLRFDFAAEVTARSLDLIDIDSGSGEATLVVQTDRFGKQRVHVVPPNWTGDILLGGVGRLTLGLGSLALQPGYGATATASEHAGFDPAGVVRLEVMLGSSGALDNLCWQPSSPPIRGDRPVRAHSRVQVPETTSSY